MIRVTQNQFERYKIIYPNIFPNDQYNSFFLTQKKKLIKEDAKEIGFVRYTDC